MKIFVSGLSQLEKRIQSIQNAVNQENMTDDLRKLAEHGEKQAQLRFETATYNGTNDVKVSSTFTSPKRFVLSAQGKAVAFIEYGTGVTYTEQHPEPLPGLAGRGQFGKKNGSQKKWGYYGELGTHPGGGKVKYNKAGLPVVITPGNPPAKALYTAGKKMEQMTRDEIFLNIKRRMWQ